MKTISAFALITILFTVAFAAINVDDQGIGFVGKGDVQLAFGWNNAALQANADNVSFRLDSESSTVTEVSWTCQRFNSQGTEFLQERARTTTTETSSGGLIDTVARVRNQITGFNLNGYAENSYSSSSNSETDGPPLNSCPAGPSGWTLLVPAGDPTVVSNTGSRTLTISAPGYMDKVIELPSSN